MLFSFVNLSFHFPFMPNCSAFLKGLNLFDYANSSKSPCNTSSDPKKVAFVFFSTESLSNQGKGMSIGKMKGKIGLNIFTDFEAS